MEITNKKAWLLLSTDVLGWYGLDIIFDLAKSAWFDGIDLCMRKNFDARNAKYVKKLTGKYDIPVRCIQVSEHVTKTEMNQALDLCEVTGAKVLTINAPSYFSFWSYNFLVDNLASYQSHNADISFAIINPDDTSFFGLPLPKYRFRNIVEIIKKYKTNVGLNLSQINPDYLEGELLKKMEKFLPNIPVVYLADKGKLGAPYLLPGEWILKLPKILKKIKEQMYDGWISIKIVIDKHALTDLDKTLLILKKCVAYYQEHYEKVEVIPLVK